MKKILRTILVVVDLFLLLAMITYIVIVCFLPGLPCYIISKISYKSMDKGLYEFEHYDINNYENTKLITHGNINIYIPKNCELFKESNDLIVYKDSETEFTALINKCPCNLSDFLSIESDNGHKAVDLYNDFLGIYPQNSFELKKLIYSVNSKYFDITDYKKSLVCMTLAVEKDLQIPLGKTYCYENSNIEGFISEQDHLLICELFGVDDLNTSYIICFNNIEDKDLVYSSINSITIN